MSVHPDLCGCCREIWNQSNLVKIPLGKHTLQLCPDCYKEYVKELQNIAIKEKEATGKEETENEQ